MREDDADAREPRVSPSEDDAVDGVKTHRTATGWKGRLWRIACGLYPHVLATITLLVVIGQWHEHRRWRNEDRLSVGLGMDPAAVMDVLLRADKCEGALNPYRRTWFSGANTTADERREMRYWRYVADEGWIAWAVSDSALWSHRIWSAVELTPAGRQVLEELGGRTNVTPSSCINAEKVPREGSVHTCEGWDSFFFCRVQGF